LREGKERTEEQCKGRARGGTEESCKGERTRKEEDKGKKKSLEK